MSRNRHDKMDVHLSLHAGHSEDFVSGTLFARKLLNRHIQARREALVGASKHDPTTRAVLEGACAMLVDLRVEFEKDMHKRLTLLREGNKDGLRP